MQKKHRKIARTCELLHGNLAFRLPDGRSYLLDEEETFEGASIRPVTMPVLIEGKTWFVVATATGSIRRLAARGSARRRRQDRDERRRGRRPDESGACVRKVLEQLRARSPDGLVVLHSDEKSSYRTLARAVFGPRLEHRTTPGTRPRTTANPLFAINTTLAMTRDNCGRLRRRSWLVSKDRHYLALQLHVFTVYRNYVRRRFNRDPRHLTAAPICVAWCCRRRSARSASRCKRCANSSSCRWATARACPRRVSAVGASDTVEGLPIKLGGFKASLAIGVRL